MIERLSMFGLDRRTLRARGGVLPSEAAILDAARPIMASDPHAGVVVLSTCERLEIYVSATPGAERAIVESAFDGKAADAIRALRGAHAMRHLLRVAAGLNSRLIGETHVLGQVRRAADLARGEGVIGKDLGRLFSLALRCGRRVRSETSLGRAGATYATLAARQALEHVAGVQGPRVGVIGTGAIALEVGEALSGHVCTVIVGRHQERTQRLARHLGGDAVRLDAFADAVPQLDALVTATGAPRPIVRAEDLAGAKRHLLVIDLGMPPNVEERARASDRISYRGLDAIAPEHLPARAVVAEAELIVEGELAKITSNVGLGRRRAGRNASPAEVTA